MQISAIIVLDSLVISALITKIIIPILTRLKASNTERTDGVKEHLKKAGTPTMGGIAFIISIIVSVIIFDRNNLTNYIPVAILSIGFALIGFIDDYMKVILSRSDGLKPKAKFSLQFLVTIVFALYLFFYQPELLKIRLPFGGGLVDIGVFSFIIIGLCVLGTVNGVNFTDGLDGLASSVTIVVGIFFCVLSFVWKSNMTVLSLSLIGALIGFLIFNSYKAKIFMGDTGSLFLGGIVAGLAYSFQIPYIIIFVGFIYLLEVCSVIIQVLYFKKTGGKRVFKMAPIHHHFELSGYSETKIVTLFSIITLVISLVCLNLL